MEAAENGYTDVAHAPTFFTEGALARPNRLCCHILSGFPCDLFLARSLSVLYAFLVFACLTTGACGLGSIATIAVSYDGNGGASVCGIMQGSVQNIQCLSSNSSLVSVSPSQTSFLGLSGGKGFVCGVRADTGRPLCWNTDNFSSPKRLKNEAYSDIVTGTSHVCALSQASTQAGNGSFATCWRNGSIEAVTPTQQSFTALASGGDFVCGLKFPDATAQCWGNSVISEPPNVTFSAIQAGASHACGITEAFNVQCWGDNSHDQLQVPDGMQFLSLALGERHSCGIEAFTRNVVCWGDSSLSRTSSPANLSFLTISAGDSFTCGILFGNSSVVCWGALFGNGTLLPLGTTVPSACTSSACDSKSFQQSSSNFSSSLFCSSSELYVCTPCRIGCQSSFIQTDQCTSDHDITCSTLFATPPINTLPPSMSPTTTVVVVITRNRLSKGLIVLIALGAAGLLCGILTIGWCVWAKCYGPVGLTFDGSQGRVHNSSIGNIGVSPLPVPMKRQRSSTSSMKRQRSSTSSVRSRGDITTGRAQAFTTADMAAATMGFSEENIIAAGSFGIVYRGMLADGREVAIKRREKETVANERSMDEKESAYQSELEFLSRLHHKHLVSLVGFCDEEDERMLVYDYMPNGTLHDHLHGSGQGKGANGVLPWQMRVKIALEAARGVEYLHTYALPPIIHRDIKSSNILLDGGWNARVSDFGLSLRGPGENSHLSLMAAGTLGYMDPEYYRLQHLTIKSDVYSFGVVLLELLTGERAIHKQSHGPVNIVDYAVPSIVNHDLASVLDQRPGAPTAKELRAMDKIAQLAVQCVRLEGKERPTMTEIVGVLEEAMAFTGNGSSRSQSSTIGSVSVIPFDTNATPFEPLEEGFDTIAVPFEALQLEATPSKALVGEMEAISVKTAESIPFVAKDDEHASSVVLVVEATSSAGGREALRTFDTSRGENEPSPDVLSASDRGTEPVEAMSDITYGGSGGAGSSEPMETIASVRGSNG
ncbi:hypothetical protein GOP47_0007901 [Adiantum capillus-veneris]|uniref:Protein kinase domain-containing protein n=1 Tax=Adiantum capillus-veneris TaxID=13818 RepID=A0A9D4V2H2_ADICA|nr:hypothetical protein GOP47_0007901 [Adiantum capillus-veneris]